MAAMDPELSELKKQVANLQVEMAEVKKMAGWWHQFSSTALPIIITIAIAVWAGITIQSDRFHDVNTRLQSLERRIERVEQNQGEMAKTLVEMNQRLARIEEMLRQPGQPRR
jgi:cell division protein FtsL